MWVGLGARFSREPTVLRLLPETSTALVLHLCRLPLSPLLSFLPRAKQRWFSGESWRVVGREPAEVARVPADPGVVEKKESGGRSSGQQSCV